MRAVAFRRFGGPEVLETLDLPRPKPGRGEVLVHVVASGVNPVDVAIREGGLASALPHVFPVVPGWEAAGVVEEIGEGTARLRKGDRVWTLARKPVVQEGTYAEYVAVAESAAALMPANLLFEEGAGVPLAASTAWQALRRAGVGAGAVVLVHAAAGGVGHFAVQLARHLGARVAGTAGPASQEFVLAQGAQLAIDTTRDDFREALRKRFPEGADVVLDLVGGETLARSFDVVKPGGIVVTTVAGADAGTGRSGVRLERVDVEADADALQLLASLAERKKLRPHVEKIHALADAAQAHEAISGGHARGKRVLAL